MLSSVLKILISSQSLMIPHHQAPGLCGINWDDGVPPNKNSGAADRAYFVRLVAHSASAYIELKILKIKFWPHSGIEYCTEHVGIAQAMSNEPGKVIKSGNSHLIPDRAYAFELSESKY